MDRDPGQADHLGVGDGHLCQPVSGEGGGTGGGRPAKERFMHVRPRQGAEGEEVDRLGVGHGARLVKPLVVV